MTTLLYIRGITIIVILILYTADDTNAIFVARVTRKRIIIRKERNNSR
jgi:hypothetical protein